MRAGKNGLGVTVVPLPGVPSVGIVLDQDAASLAQSVGAYEDRTTGCTPLPEADRERLDQASSGAPVPAEEYRSYVAGLFAAMQESSAAQTQLTALSQERRLPGHVVEQIRSADKGPTSWDTTESERARQFLSLEDSPADSGFKVLIAPGRHSWDWWTAPADDEYSRNSAGTWSIVSLPWRRFYTEGPYPVHPVVLLSHQLAHVMEAYEGRFDAEKSRVKVEALRTVQQPIGEHLARGVHPCQRHGGVLQSQPFSFQNSKDAAAKASERWARTPGHGRTTHPWALRNTMSDILFSERKVADELGIYPHRSYAEKEAETQELYLQSSSTDELTALVRGMRNQGRPWALRRYWTALPEEYERYKLKQQGVAKKGISCVIRPDLLPKDSRLAAVYERIAGPQASSTMGQGLDAGLGTIVEEAAKQTADAVFPVASVFAAVGTAANTVNLATHTVRKEWSNGLSAGPTDSGRGSKADGLNRRRSMYVKKPQQATASVPQQQRPVNWPPRSGVSRTFSAMFGVGGGPCPRPAPPNPASSPPTSQPAATHRKKKALEAAF